MAVPKAYLTSFKNVRNIFSAIRGAQAPPKFTVRFLESLGFKTPSDRLIINILKSLGLLNSNGEPTKRYFEFLDESQAGRVLADGIREAYADLFQINIKANELSQSDIKNKLKTLTQGQASESVLDKMSGTFKALTGMADFSAKPVKDNEEAAKPEEGTLVATGSLPRTGLKIGGLVYNIQLVLPESREQAVYDALFRSLREHLYE